MGNSMKNKPLVSIVLSLFAFTAAAAQSQVDIRDRIKDQASRIIENADQSRATESELQRVLQQLRHINTILGSPDGGSSDELFCEPRNTSYSYVTRSRDGHKFGNDVLNAQCQRIIANSRNGIVCGPRSSAYASIYNISTGAELGQDVLTDACIGLVTASNRQLVCGPQSSSYANVYRIRDGVPLGQDVLHNKCKEVIANATTQLVCAPRSSSHAHITRIATGETIGSDILFNACYQRIRQ